MAPRMPMKFRYSIISVLMVWLSIFVAAYPVWVISEYLSVFLNIPDGASIADQANGWLWLTLFILEFLIVVTVCYAIWSLVFGKLNGWSPKKSFNVFFKFNYPKHWYKAKVT